MLKCVWYDGIYLAKVLCAGFQFTGLGLMSQFCWGICLSGLGGLLGGVSWLQFTDWSLLGGAIGYEGLARVCLVVWLCWLTGWSLLGQVCLVISNR